MQTIHAILFGSFVLILIYLGVKNASGATSILDTGGNQINQYARTLQGR